MTSRSLTLTLAPMTLAHCQALFCLTVSSRAHLRAWLPWADYIQTQSDTDAFVQDAITQTAQGRQMHFVMMLDTCVIGTISVIDIEAGQGTVGYWIGERHKNCGYTSEAMMQLLTMLHDGDDIKRLRLEVLGGNVASEKVAQRCGFILHESIENGALLHGQSLPRLIYMRELSSVICPRSPSHC